MKKTNRLSYILILLTILWLFFSRTYVFAQIFTYKDKFGRDVTLSTPVQRAVLLATYELIPVMNIWDKIVGVGRWAYTDSLMLAVRPDIATFIPSVGSGTDLNAELLIKLKPDVVVTFRVGIDIIRFLEEKGIKVIAIYPESFSELYEVIYMHGRLFGKEKEIIKAVREMKTLSEIINRRISKIPEKYKKKILWLHHKPNTVAGGKGIINETIKHIGGINVASDLFPDENVANIPFERIVALNPDIIFVWGYATFSVQELLSNHQWKNIKAVKEGRVFKVLPWSNWSPRQSLITLWMAMRAYPEHFRDIDFDKIADDFYRKVFNIPYSKVKQIEN